jgi:hypothetical protein
MNIVFFGRPDILRKSNDELIKLFPIRDVL